MRVEFFGMARTRSGVEAVELNAARLSEVISDLQVRFPDLAGKCFQDGQLSSGWLFNLNGQQFTRDVDTCLTEGDHLLLMSADAGG